MSFEISFHSGETGAVASQITPIERLPIWPTWAQHSCFPRGKAAGQIASWKQQIWCIRGICATVRGRNPSTFPQTRKSCNRTKATPNFQMQGLQILESPRKKPNMTSFHITLHRAGGRGAIGCLLQLYTTLYISSLRHLASSYWQLDKCYYKRTRVRSRSQELDNSCRMHL